MEVNIKFVTFLTETIVEVQFMLMIVEHSTSTPVSVYHTILLSVKFEYNIHWEHNKLCNFLNRNH